MFRLLYRLFPFHLYAKQQQKIRNYDSWLRNANNVTKEITSTSLQWLSICWALNAHLLCYKRLNVVQVDKSRWNKMPTTQHTTTTATRNRRKIMPTKWFSSLSTSRSFDARKLHPTLGQTFAQVAITESGYFCGALGYYTLI